MLDSLIILCQSKAALAFTPDRVEDGVVSIGKTLVKGAKCEDRMLYDWFVEACLQFSHVRDAFRKFE